MDTAEQLNELEATPQTEGGKITALVIWTSYDDEKRRQTGLSGEETELTDEQYAELGLDKNDLGCIDDHPEGSDRGGYVPTLNDGSYYMENDGEWY